MLESLAVSLLKTLVVFIFQSSLERGVKVDIEGAPAWFGKSESGAFCVSTFEKGGYEAEEKVREKLYIKAEKEIRDLISVAVYKNFRDLKDPKERAFVKSVVEDPQLSLFVKGYLKLKNVYYDEDRKIAFARGCISEEDFRVYAERRLREIRKSLSIKRSEDAFRELETIE